MSGDTLFQQRTAHWRSSDMYDQIAREATVGVMDK